MSFLYPLGLLGLIGIPILIFIYIIKNKYTEQTVSSTYLWTLSERFLKRKKRVSRLAGIISLLLQILAVTVISLLIAHPIITIPDAAHEYCIILDGSGSMHMDSTVAKESGETVLTRFEAGKKAISDMVDDAVDGSNFTLIYVGDTTDVIFEKSTDKDQIELLLSDLKPAYDSTDLTEAIGLAQGYFNVNTSTRTYLVTDTTYEAVENIEVINVAQSVENYALSEVIYNLKGSQLTVSGKVASHTSDATLTLNLYLNGEDTIVDTKQVQVKAGEPAVFTLSANVRSFASIAVRIMETDALALDNEYRIYDVESEASYNTLIVSERPFFLESALRSMLNADIQVISPSEYTGQTGYGLYVFDSVDASTVPTLPADGTVWLVNVPGSIEGAGYSAQGEVTPEKAVTLTHATSTATATQALVKDMKQNEIYVTHYIKNSLRRNFSTLLSYKGNPVVFAGTNEHGNREVVIGFDLHRSNFPLLYDYTVLMRNLVQYSFPEMIETTTFTCGESATIDEVMIRFAK